MRAPVRLLLLVAVPLAVLCTAILLFADGSGPRGTALGHWLREIQRGERLDAAAPVLIRGAERTQSILAALVEGRLTLADAAEQLRSERESCPRPFRIDPILNPGESVEEYYLRTTVQQVEWYLYGEERQRTVVRRLQQELQNYLAQEAEYPVTAQEQGDDAPEQVSSE